MLNRESHRAVDAYESIKAIVKETRGDANDKVFKINCDLMSFASVEKAAEEVKSTFPDGIDVLCNNAGIMAFPNQATKDGYDAQMQVNHISHFLLTKELFPLLEKKAEVTGEARIINHTSVARLGSPLDQKYFEKNGGKEILGNNNGDEWERYHQSKLANLVFTYALRDRLSAKGSKVISAVAHPGGSKTNLMDSTAKSNGGGVIIAHVLSLETTCSSSLYCNLNFDFFCLCVTIQGSGSLSFFQLIRPFMFQSIEDGAVGIGRCSLQEGIKNGDFYGPGSYVSSLKGDAVLLKPEAISEESKKMLWETSELAVGKFEI